MDQEAWRKVGLVNPSTHFTLTPLARDSVGQTVVEVGDQLVVGGGLFKVDSCVAV